LSNALLPTLRASRIGIAEALRYVGLSLLVAVTVGLGSTLLLAYHAARLNVAEALRFVV
jgi:ABC-type lipoprotein release transport system permease subunit